MLRAFVNAFYYFLFAPPSNIKFTFLYDFYFYLNEKYSLKTLFIRLIL